MLYYVDAGAFCSIDRIQPVEVCVCVLGDGAKVIQVNVLFLNGYPLSFFTTKNDDILTTAGILFWGGCHTVF